MKKIISIVLALSVCLTMIVCADENNIDDIIEPQTENSETLLEAADIKESAEEEFSAEEALELPESNGVTLYAAAEIIASGECGENGGNITWSLDNKGTLTLSGSGNLANYRRETDVPWYYYSYQIQNVNLDIVTETFCTAMHCHAFKMLSNVSEIIVPEGVIEIPQSYDLFPETLRRLVLPSTYVGDLSSNMSIMKMCYLNIEVSEDNPIYSSADGTLFNKDKTKLIQYTRSAIEPNYIVPETVTDIDEAFCGNEYLQTLTISKNVEIVDTDIYNGIFSEHGMGDCANDSQCSAVYVDPENPYFCSVDGVLYSKDMSMLIWYPPNREVSFCIPETVKMIAPSAFQSSKLSDIQIPESVEIIGMCSFKESHIESVRLPNSIRTIHQSCLFNCPYLKKVYIEVSENAEYSFQLFDSYNLKTAGPMGSGCDIEFCWTGKIPQNVFSSCQSLTKIIIPDSVTIIEDMAFSFCGNLTDINIPEGIAEIGWYAFGYCESLTEITLPHSVTSIDTFVFDACSALSDIYIDKAEGIVKGAPWGAQNASITYLREMKIAPVTKSYTYTGKAIMPAVSITEDRTDGTASYKLREYEDYILAYSDNINAGTAEMKISFINGFAKLRSEKQSFTITSKSIDGLVFEPIPNQYYTSRAVTPDIEITDLER